MTSGTLVDRTARHVRLAAQAHGLTPLETPPFLVVHINSSCNLQCEHCCVHDRLNQPDDLRLAELVKLSEELGRLEALHLAGGEPFLRDELAAICSQFIRQNSLRKLSIATSGYHVERIARAVEYVLRNAELKQLTVELGLDGTARFHNRCRGDARSFDNAIQSYYALAAIQRRDPRLYLRVVSTATADNLQEIEQLSSYLYDRCPQLERHGVTMLRGERRRSSLKAPMLSQYLELERKLRALWSERERDPVQRVIEPVTAWAKAQTLERREQVVPCKAGVLSALVYANGDVSVCETLTSHPILGNLREHSFRELWNSTQAQKARVMIRARQCACASEHALACSLTYEPAQLLRAVVRDKLRAKPKPLPIEPLLPPPAGPRPLPREDRARRIHLPLAEI